MTRRPRKGRTSGNRLDVGKVMAVVTRVGSVAALVVCIRSCSLAENANRLSEASTQLVRAQFESERAVVWRWYLDRQRFTINLQPTDNSIIVESVSVKLPSTAPFGAKVIEPGAILNKAPYPLSLSPIGDYLCSVSHAAVWMQMRVPLVIVSRYEAMGGVHEDASLYLLDIVYARIPMNQEPRVLVSGIHLQERVHPREAQRTVDRVWDEEYNPVPPPLRDQSS